MKNCNILMYRCAYPFKKGAEKVSASARKEGKEGLRTIRCCRHLFANMELREAGHTQLLANFARFFKAKRDQGAYEVRGACSVQRAAALPPPRRPQCRPPQVEAAIQDFWEQRVEDATFTQAEVSRRLSLSHVRGASRRAVRLLRC